MATAEDRMAAELLAMKVEVAKMLANMAKTDTALKDKQDAMDLIAMQLEYVNVEILKMQTDNAKITEELREEKEKGREKRKGWRLAEDKGMGDIGKFAGEAKEYEDWSFTIGLFMQRKKGMTEMLQWLYGLRVEPVDYSDFTILHPEFSVEDIEDVNS